MSGRSTHRASSTRSLRRRGCLTALTLGVLLVGSAPAMALSEGPVESGTGWLSAHIGLTFGDSLSLGEATLQTSEGTPAPVFAVSGFYRTPRLDFGAMIEGIGGFAMKDLRQPNRTGGQLRVAGVLRWRYIDEGWGALFLRLSPGLMIFDHDEKLRLIAAKTVDDTVTDSDVERVDDLTFGFSLGFDFGIVVYLGRATALVINLDVITGTTSLDALGQSVDYAVIRGLFSVGIEWRM